MTRSKQSPRKNRKSQKSTTAPPDIDLAVARQRDAERGRVPMRFIVLAAAVLAAIVVFGGLAFQFLTSGWRHELSGGVPAVAAAAFVGSDVCAG
jgi:hypothetical protein